MSYNKPDCNLPVAVYLDSLTGMREYHNDNRFDYKHKVINEGMIDELISAKRIDILRELVKPQAKIALVYHYNYTTLTKLEMTTKIVNAHKELANDSRMIDLMLMDDVQWDWELLQHDDSLCMIRSDRYYIQGPLLSIITKISARCDQPTLIKVVANFIKVSHVRLFTKSKIPLDLIIKACPVHKLFDVRTVMSMYKHYGNLIFQYHDLIWSRTAELFAENYDDISIIQCLSKMSMDNYIHLLPPRPLCTMWYMTTQKQVVFRVDCIPISLNLLSYHNCIIHLRNMNAAGLHSDGWSHIIDIYLEYITRGSRKIHQQLQSALNNGTNLDLDLD